MKYLLVSWVSLISYLHDKSFSNFSHRFEFFYEKTGVTGPYMFGTGLITYLCSKEIYVMEHEFYTGLSLAVICIIATKKLGPVIAKYADGEVDVSITF